MGHDVVICQMIKDEHRYLIQWVEHHLRLGVKHFYLYEDVGSLSHDRLIEPYRDVITLWKIEDVLTEYEKQWVIDEIYHAQIVCLMNFIRRYKHQHDYLLFIDPDEYLDVDVSYIINENPNALTYKMKWRVMTCEDPTVKMPEVYSLYDTYKMECFPLDGDLQKLQRKYLDTKLMLNLNHPVLQDDKFIWNPNVSWMFMPHKLSTLDEVIIKEKILNHYMFKSFYEYVDRLRIKGEIMKASWNKRLCEFFMYNHHIPSEKRKEMLDSIGGRVKVKITHDDRVKAFKASLPPHYPSVDRVERPEDELSNHA